MIIRRHSRRSVPSPTASSLPHCPPLSLSSNSFPHNLLSDPHSLNPAVSIFYKNGGGRGPVRCFERSNVQTCRCSSALLIHPLSFLHLTDSSTQRPLHNSFGIRSLRTLFVATEGVPPCALPTRPNQGLAGEGGGLTGVPDPSFSVWTKSTGRFSNRSTKPLGQRTCTHSTLLADPRPKWTRMSLLEM